MARLETKPIVFDQQNNPETPTFTGVVIGGVYMSPCETEHSQPFNKSSNSADKPITPEEALTKHLS